MVENLQALCIDTAYACAVGVGIAVVSYGVVRGSKMLARNARKLAAVSLVGAILVGGMVVVGTDGAGTKPSTNDVSQVEGGTNTTRQTEGDTNVVTQTGDGLTGTNGTGNAGGPLRLGLFGRPNLDQLFETITDEDIAQGWRVISVSSNVLPAATFTMPTNAIVWESAQRCGRGWGSWKIPVGGWHFPFSTFHFTFDMGRGLFPFVF